MYSFATAEKFAVPWAINRHCPLIIFIRDTLIEK